MHQPTGENKRRWSASYTAAESPVESESSNAMLYASFRENKRDDALSTTPFKRSTKRHRTAKPTSSNNNEEKERTAAQFFLSSRFFSIVHRSVLSMAMLDVLFVRVEEHSSHYGQHEPPTI